VGVEFLVSEGAYTAFFNLHDDDQSENINLRTFLQKHWVSTYTKPQPLDDVAEYFGEKVALYFAFIGFYNLWLCSICAVGLFVFIYGLGRSFK
jgi:anoctamin-7